jgi:hypothetical protein
MCQLQTTVLLSIAAQDHHCLCCQALLPEDTTFDHCTDCLLQIACGDDYDAFALPLEDDDSSDADLDTCGRCGEWAWACSCTPCELGVPCPYGCPTCRPPSCPHCNGNPSECGCPMYRPF